MRKLAIFTAAALTALAAFCAWGGWVYEGQWGSRGSGDGQFQEVSDVDVALNGNVYVADCGNHRLQYFSPAGSFLGKWGRFGDGDREFSYPRGVAVASGGRVYVAALAALGAGPAGGLAALVAAAGPCSGLPFLARRSKIPHVRAIKRAPFRQFR